MKTKITKNITLNFPKSGPFIYRYMEHDWNKVRTLKEALKFYHKWHNDMLSSKNPVRIEAIKSIIYPLYSKLLNKSYERILNVA